MESLRTGGRRMDQRWDDAFFERFIEANGIGPHVPYPNGPEARIDALEARVEALEAASSLRGAGSSTSEPRAACVAVAAAKPAWSTMRSISGGSDPRSDREPSPASLAPLPAPRCRERRCCTRRGRGLADSRPPEVGNTACGFAPRGRRADRSYQSPPIRGEGWRTHRRLLPDAGSKK